MQQDNQQRVRISVSIPAEIARQLDHQREHTGMNRSEAVAEAVREWVERGIEADVERISGQSQQINQLRRELAEQTEQSAQEIVALLQYQFSGLAGFDEAELERRGREQVRKRQQRRRRQGERQPQAAPSFTHAKAGE